MAASLFFGYTFVMTACFFLLTGTVGYFSCQWFINLIYSSIKARQFGRSPCRTLRVYSPSAFFPPARNCCSTLVTRVMSSRTPG